MKKSTNIKAVMDEIKDAMLEDPAYAYAWHANIAMAMFDELPETFWMPDKSAYHKICNKAATRFMKTCFGVDTSYKMLDGAIYTEEDDEIDV